MLRVFIDDIVLGTFEMPARERQQLWQRVTSMSVPVSPGAGNFGVGGASSEVEISDGMNRLTASWWKDPPEEWNELASIFDWLAARLPRDITSRYDFGRGGD